MTYKFIIILFIIIILAGSLSFISAEDSENNGDYVIIIHGLGRSKFSMLEPAIYFRKKGYRVINYDYPSTDYRIQVLAEKYLQEAINKCNDDSKRINFLTHSLGGIVVRYYLKKHKLDNLGRVVMLSPPNNGSELVDILADFPTIRWRSGPVIQQLQTGEEGLTCDLGPVNYETGIITGNRSYSILSSLIISGKDDGKVSVSSAKVKNMKDFMIVNRTHTFIMNSDIVLKEALNFIKYGKFKRDVKNNIDLHNIQLDFIYDFNGG